MTPISAISDPELAELAESAINYLLSHSWCRTIRKGHMAFGIGGVIGVFLLTIEPAQPDVDDTLWIVVGDVPPAYLVCDDASDWRAALESYICEMRRWVAAVRSGTSLEDVIPVSAAATSWHADMLESRLDFIQTRVLDDPTVGTTHKRLTRRCS